MAGKRNKSENQNITIAIDGWSSCGKSTLAKALAKALNYIYVDSGAMYRGVALYVLRNNLIEGDYIKTEKLIGSLPAIHLSFKQNKKGQNELFLNNENVEKDIRTIEISNIVSPVAKIKEVRSFLVEQQQNLGKNGGIVMDGRDIGSVVFPKAELKLFLTADIDIRTHRRYSELRAKGFSITIEEVAQNLKKRDEMDANREESPLIQTEDAIVLDNSNLTQQQQLKEVLKMVREIQKIR